MNDMMRHRCIDFLILNGWKMAEDCGEEFDSFYKDGHIGVDISRDEIVFVSDIGDILHLPMNYYALLGALLEYRELAYNYISVKHLIIGDVLCDLLEKAKNK